MINRRRFNSSNGDEVGQLFDEFCIENFGAELDNLDFVKLGYKDMDDFLIDVEDTFNKWLHFVFGDNLGYWMDGEDEDKRRVRNYFLNIRGLYSPDTRSWYDRFEH
jgi:hypothetical protein